MKYYEQRSIAMPGDMQEKLAILAQKKDMSLSALVRTIINEFLEKRDKCGSGKAE